MATHSNSYPGVFREPAYGLALIVLLQSGAKGSRGPAPATLLLQTSDGYPRVTNRWTLCTHDHQHFISKPCRTCVGPCAPRRASRWVRADPGQLRPEEWPLLERRLWQQCAVPRR
ncbi:hypothetical protein PsYK624_141690 [Phanerochaete sordida]|uniref:Uncharacterized protein n=1 Tax=Phanerochaete sordida TaxID=48140 RepID=A0A9P3LL56_9APHY|nr:hypothetical protein PsYK624_141690 [Phanerochaete sordida]